MRDEKGNIVPPDQVAFERQRLLDLARKKLDEKLVGTGAISKMNAPSPISRAFRGERVPNMMSRRLRQKKEQEQEGSQEEQEPEPHTQGCAPNRAQRIAQEQPVEPEPEPIVVKKHLTVKLPEETQTQLDQIQDSLRGAEKDIVALAQVLKDFLEKSERAKHQDIDALFRNRCANRRTQGFCKLTAKGKLAKGAQLKKG